VPEEGPLVDPSEPPTDSATTLAPDTTPP